VGKPFEVYIDCGTPNPVRFTLDEESLRADRSIHVQHALADNRGDPDERMRLWRGARAIAAWLLKESPSGPIEIFDGPDLWIIPEGSVRWVRLHDPESPDKRHTEIGFRHEGED
jgi:hypothetical protein